MTMKTGHQDKRWRVWQKRFVQLALVLSLAGVISLAWSLTSGEEEGFVLSKPSTASSIEPVDHATSTNQHPNDSPSATGPTSEQIHETVPTRTPRPSDAEEIPVYLVGAVNKPGVYIIRRGTYLYELIELAGGLTADAAHDSVNLAMQIKENQMIRIPDASELDQAGGPGIGMVGGSANAGGSASGRININQASQAELESLPGIGPATAAAILADRDKNGPFHEIEDIMRVPGIKESRFVLMEALITVG